LAATNWPLLMGKAFPKGNWAVNRVWFPQGFKKIGHHWRPGARFWRHWLPFFPPGPTKAGGKQVGALGRNRQPSQTCPGEEKEPGFFPRGGNCSIGGKELVLLASQRGGGTGNYSPRLGTTGGEIERLVRGALVNFPFKWAW